MVANYARTRLFAGQGFDTCQVPALQQLANWFVSSPFGAVNLYIGGSSRACANAPLTAAYVAQVQRQGWTFIPTWVGPQAACSGFRSSMSYDTTIAYDQGKAEAQQAASVAAGLGLAAPDGSGAIIYYDLESYDTSDTACRAAARSFVSGWSAGLHARGSAAALYGAPCSSALNDMVTLPEPLEGVWIAQWFLPPGYRPNASVWGVSCVSDTLWVNHQRLRQYSGGHYETWGGVSLNIDDNVLDGIVSIVPVAPDPAAHPYPPDDAGGASVSLSVRWSGHDPNPGDSLTYQVYLNAGSDPTTLVCTTSAGACVLPADLAYATDYSWQVVTTDQTGLSSAGPTWHFRTRPAGLDLRQFLPVLTTGT